MNATATTDTDGNLVQESVARYLPFGAARQLPGTRPEVSDRGFTGHRQIAYIKLIDMQARWYAPEIQRFISADTIVPDPTNPQSLNRYAYVLNNPVNLVDPTGHSCASPDDSAERLECASIEQQIADATVLIEYQGFYIMSTPGGNDVIVPFSEVANAFSYAHGTIIDSQTVLTHDHFKWSEDNMLASYTGFVLTHVQLYGTHGETITNDFSFITNAAETSLLVFSESIFDVGSQEMEFLFSGDVMPRVGDEVAIIDWNIGDVHSTHVNWTSVIDIDESTRNFTQYTTTPSVSGGASGGGLFWKGVHFANTWYIQPPNITVSVENSLQVSSE
jgi:RHS repeat-associated protein